MIHSAERVNILPALVIGVDVSALTVVRSLGRRGIPVHVLGSNPRDYAAVSRYARYFHCEDLSDEASFLAALARYADSIGLKSVLIPTSDLHVLFISRHRETLSTSFCFVLPDHRIIETLMDKKNLYDFAVRHNFLVPRTFLSTSSNELREIAAKIPFPCVVKPLYRTAFWSRNVPPAKKVMKAVSGDDLWQKIEEIGALDEQLIVQEWIPGGDDSIYFCLAYLDRNGFPRAACAGRKLRQYPFLTGVTSLAESIVDETLVALALKILQTAGCVGLCSVEFKYDAASTTFKMTEPTVGRVDLQEGVSVAAGLDIPHIAYQDAIGIAGGMPAGYRAGVTWINEPFEFNSFLAWGAFKKKEAGPFFQSYGSEKNYAVFAVDDLKPFIRFLVAVARRCCRALKLRFSDCHQPI